MKKIIVSLSAFVVLLALPFLLFAQDAGTLDLEKYLQSRPELRGKIPAKAPAAAKTPARPLEEAAAPGAAVQEKAAPSFPTLEVLIRERGIIPPEELRVFGQQLFSAGPTTFAPPANIPVTADYVVGPDDTIVVNVWGRLNQTYTLTVQRNGSVNIPQVGSIHVAGLTYKKLVEVIRKEVESVLGVNASVTMGELRSITVFVVGAVKQPGAYTVSAFDTILNALIYAGGPDVQSRLDEWYRDKLKQENVDVRQLVDKLKKERDIRIVGRMSEADAGRVAAPAGPLPAAMAKRDSSSLMQLLTILKEEREAEDVIRRVRELDGEQLQKELENLESGEKKQDRYSSLRQLIERIKTDKELAEQRKDYENLDVRQLEDELRKLDIIAERQERDYTLKQHAHAQERYKGVQTEKEILLPAQLGSMRNIQLRRDDKAVSTLDLYDLLLAGDKSRDLRLQQGDVIFVPKPEATVAIFGDVKVPALYEIKKGQPLPAALELAGGLKTSAYGGQIQVQRYARNQERVVLDTSLDALDAGMAPFILQDGDRVQVFRVPDEDVNAVYLFGNVKRPGKYQFRSGLRVSDVIGERDLHPETDLSYAFLKRYKRPEMMPAIVPFNLGEAILGKAPAEDLALQPYDEIYVFRRWDFQHKPDITIAGEVRNPGKYPLQKNMRVKDALFMAGGPNINAYLDAAHIFRTNPRTRSVTMLPVDLSRALAEREDSNILLQERDRLVVHHIQGYKPEQFVTVEGEVRNTGKYPLTEGMTIRDLLFAAGNVLEGAWLDDAELTSMITDGGRAVRYQQRNLDLRKVIAGDASQNVLLKAYDRLFVKRIPDWRLEKFVTAAGEVKFPGRYAIRKGEKLSSLIERAGGYRETAYLRGAVFTRERVRTLQQQSILEMADRMERELLASASGQVSTALSTEEVMAKKVELEQRQKFIQSLRQLKATGRMTIYLAHMRLLKGSEYDIELEDGDSLTIPPKNSVVNVVGAVMAQGTYIFSDKMTYQDYIRETGGYSRYADPDNVFVMKVDGSARKLARGLLDWSPSRNRWEMAGFGESVSTIEPGDTIVVPEKVERIAWLREIRDITQILMNTAVTAGVIIKLW